MFLNKEIKVGFDKVCNGFDPLPEITRAAAKNSVTTGSKGSNDVSNTGKVPAMVSGTKDKTDDNSSGESIEPTIPDSLSGTPCSYYEIPLMVVLVKHSGCTRSDALSELKKIVPLKDGDFEKYSTGEQKWKARASRARESLIAMGYMEANDKNRWELTEIGLKIADGFRDYAYPSFLPGREPKKSGKYLKLKELRVALLHALADLKGRAARQKVLEHLDVVLSDRFHAGDFEIQQNSPRWQVQTSKAMSSLKTKERFTYYPDVGEWALTEKGWIWVENNKSTLFL